MRYLLSLLLFSLLLGCSNSDVAGGTGTGNPIIAGVAIRSNGTPAAFATLRVRANDFDGSSQEYPYLGDEFNAQGELTTAEDGSFTFSLTDEGEYIMEVVDPSTHEAFAHFFTVSDPMQKITIPSAQMAPLDTIKGSISLHGASTSAPMTVHAMGTTRTATVESDGAYTLAVPVGVYSLHVAILSDEYAPIKILNISSGDSIGVFRHLAKAPISNDYTCDSLIIRHLLSSNNLTTIPVNAVSWVNSNGRIIELDFAPAGKYGSAYNVSSSIITLPTEIGGLTELQKLYIQNTPLTELPASIGQLSKLMILAIDHNELTTLPISFAGLTPTTYVNLAGNRLTTLPEPLLTWANLNDQDWLITQK